MRHFFISLFATIVGLFLFFILGFFFLIFLGAIFSPKPATQNAVVLDLDLTSGLSDQRVQGFLDEGSPGMIDIVQRLDKAKNDDKVKGLFIRVNPYGMPPAQAEELRLSILDFKASGKFVVAHAQGFEGTSVSNYYAVSAASDLWVQDTATFSAAGYRAETPFYGGVAEKYDAKPEFVQFYEYKNAANVYTETGYTDAHREATTEMLGSLFDSALNFVAEDREAIDSPAAARAIFEGAPYSAERAKELGLIDTLGHYKASRDAALERAGTGASFKDIEDYGTNFTGPTIALVTGQGAIITGEGGAANPFGGSPMIGGDSMSEAIFKAAEDDNVKAIIIRVDSPGGSAIASDQIWDAVIQAKEAGKPVVISMAQYAASGGYYIAAPADYIVALDTTLTGSIGVLGGKIALEDTYAKIGYNIESISVGGDYTSVYSSDEPWNQATRAAYTQMMEDIYVDFTTRVSDGRGMSIDTVREIAKGRVWTGAQGLTNGLVDERGGLLVAVDAAKRLADIEEDKAVRLKQFPRPKTTSEMLSELFGGEAEAKLSLSDLIAMQDMPEVQAYVKMREDMMMAQDKTLLARIPEIK